MNGSPLVTAGMLTGKGKDRERFAKVAIRCFLEQDWPNKELVIINHGDFRLKDSFPQDNVHEYRIERENMGAMRQMYLDRAKGEYLIQWDDDDIHLPRRISSQVAVLLDNSSIEACYLSTQLRYSMKTNCALVGWNRRAPGIDGTVCHRMDSKYRFADVPAREDSIFKRHFTGAMVVVRGEMLFIRLHHGNNIMGEGFIMYDLTGKKDIWRLTPALGQLLRESLAEYYDIGVVDSKLRAPHRIPRDKLVACS